MKKRFAILRRTADGHTELHAETDLISEARRFEALGYLVIPSRELGLTPWRRHPSEVVRLFHQYGYSTNLPALPASA